MLLLVLAEGAPAVRSRLTPGELLWTALPLIGALLVGAFVIYLIDRWRKRRAARNDLCDPNDQLSHFRSLYERGAMSAEEFQRLRTLLSGQVVGRAERDPETGAIQKPQVQQPPTGIQPKPPGEEPPPAADAPPTPPDGIRPA